MRKSEKAGKITVEYVLEKFVDLLDSDAAWAVKVKGLELLGKYLDMFKDQKKVDVSFRSFITGASLEDLQRLAGERYDDTTKVVGRSGECFVNSGDSGDGRRLLSETGECRNSDN
jgi:hypothetical protein